MLRGKNICYLRSIRAFAAWLGGAAVTKDAVTEWKSQLVERRQAPSTINTALAALNGLFRFLGWEDCRAKFLKVQRRIFCAPERELTRAEYAGLLAAAQSSGDTRLAPLMESIFSVLPQFQPVCPHHVPGHRHSGQHHAAGRETAEAAPAAERGHFVPSIRRQKECGSRQLRSRTGGDSLCPYQGK